MHAKARPTSLCRHVWVRGRILADAGKLVPGNNGANKIVVRLANCDYYSRVRVELSSPESGVRAWDGCQTLCSCYTTLAETKQAWAGNCVSIVVYALSSDFFDIKTLKPLTCQAMAGDSLLGTRGWSPPAVSRSIKQYCKNNLLIGFGCASFRKFGFLIC